ncbi:MAG: T9SS type A sorting domain-containing protein, partial [bacterium]
TNRPAGSDLSKGDAMAADENFGITVFGDKGSSSSNTNSSDPAFDPSNGESLKIIPPVDSVATIKVYNMDQELIFETSSRAPGRPAEWDGSSFNTSIVNNGVYVVKVRSGSEVKTFPVVVLK